MWGEKQVSPFVRAVAGVALGGEALVARARAMVPGRMDDGDQPSLAALRRQGRADPSAVEEAVLQVFARAHPARQRRLQMYALRPHSRLRSAEIARRYGRGPSAVTMAARELAAEVTTNPEPAAGLATLAEVVGA